MGVRQFELVTISAVEHVETRTRRLFKTKNGQAVNEDVESNVKLRHSFVAVVDTVGLGVFVKLVLLAEARLRSAKRMSQRDLFFPSRQKKDLENSNALDAF